MYFLDQAYDWNVTIFALEIITLVLAFLIIIVGLIQNKQGQQGLSALNGGNEELFFNTKERGLDFTLSKVMLVLGILLFVTALLIYVFTKYFLAS